MKLNITISRFSNLLFFAQKEKVFDIELQKYLTNEHADVLFYGRNKGEILRNFKKSAGENKLKKLKKSISSINSEFTPYWNKTSKQLLLWKQYFKKNQPLLLQAISEIKKLNGVKNFDISKIPIYLISTPFSKEKEINDVWFSWTPKESFIVVEIPPSTAPKNLFPLSILAHEFFHLACRKNEKLFLKISEIAEKNKKLLSSLSDGMPEQLFLEELLISSFIPEGYLGKKIFHSKLGDFNKKPKDLVDWRRFIALSMCDEAKKYIQEARIIDDKYIKKLIEIL